MLDTTDSGKAKPTKAKKPPKKARKRKSAQPEQTKPIDTDPRGTFLAAIADAVGGKVTKRNFRKYSIVVLVPGDNDRAYPRTFCTLQLNKKGEATYRYSFNEKDQPKLLNGQNPKDFAPDEDQLADIAKQWTAEKLPKSSGGAIGDLPEALKDVPEEELYFFLDDLGKHVLMIEHRTSDKDFHRYTWFTDGVWYEMEPDDGLPIYGLEKLRSTLHNPARGKGDQTYISCPRVMIHEGPKKARALHNFTDEDWGKHPWCEELREYIHIAPTGGAERMHEVNWDLLRPFKKHCNDLVYVCDNDDPGVEAARDVSRLLLWPMQRVCFGNEFPDGFDLADEWPRASLSGTAWYETIYTREVYTGPVFKDCLNPATWAVRAIQVSKRKRTYVLRPEFIKEWIFAVDPGIVISSRHVSRRYKKDMFNDLIAPFSNGANVVNLLREEPKAQVERVVYDPSKPSGVVRDGGRVVNVFEPSPIKPMGKVSADDVKPFLDYMAHLVPNETDRPHLMKWCAALIARPDMNMDWAVLLYSETQGVGKSTLGERILKPLLGKSNVSFPSATQIAESQFNSWATYKRLVVINELYENYSSKTYNKLQPIITDENITVNEKNMPTFHIDNWVHVFACTNQEKALRLPNAEERRWFIPEITNAKREPSYWLEFNGWLETGGLQIIASWAKEYVKVWAPGYELNAPASTTKIKLAIETMSEGKRMAYDLGDQIARAQSPVCVRVDKVHEWIKGNLAGRDKMESEKTIGHALRQAGLKGTDKQFYDARMKKRFRVVCNFEIKDGETSATIEPKLKAPELCLGM